jgi:hypothetical protein
MRHALWLGLSMMWASAAHAQQLAPVQLQVRGVVQPAPLTLRAPMELAADAALTPVALTPPCLGCRMGLRSATQDYAPDPAPPVPAAQPAPRPVKKPQLALGDSWKLGGGRTLSVRLTPTPEECAPLVKLSF